MEAEQKGANSRRAVRRQSENVAGFANQQAGGKSDDRHIGLPPHESEAQAVAPGTTGAQVAAAASVSEARTGPGLAQRAAAVEGGRRLAVANAPGEQVIPGELEKALGILADGSGHRLRRRVGGGAGGGGRERRQLPADGESRTALM